MISLKAEKRSDKKTDKIREENLVPAVLYGPEIENIKLQVNLVDFEKAYQDASDSSLISLKVEGKEYLALIRNPQFAPVSDNPIHVDFYQPPLKEEVEVEVPLIFEGESLAVKNLGGTLVKTISELPIKALPQDLPKELRVSINSLETFNDKILVKDLFKDSQKFTIMKDLEDVVASVSRPEEIEEEEPELGDIIEEGEGIEEIREGPEGIKEETKEEETEEKPKE